MNDLLDKIVIFIMLLLVLVLFFLIVTPRQTNAAEQDTYIPQSQVDLCEYYGDYYGICPEVLEALIEAESSGKMTARNGSCYGICQINGAVHGYEYSTEDAQIEKCCQLLLSYDDEIGIALAKYNGQRKPQYNGYVQKVLNRAHDLEVIHGK